MYQNRLLALLCLDPLGKLTALHRAPSWTWGGDPQDSKWIQRVRRERGNEGKGKEGKSRKKKKATKVSHWHYFSPPQPE